MKRSPPRGRHQDQVAKKRTTSDDRYVCCQCNEVIDESALVKDSPFSKKCRQGHTVLVVRPAPIAFLQGLGWGTVLMVEGALAALFFNSSRLAILGAAGAICSALACRKMLEGILYLKLPEPTKNIARQLVSEAAGAWLAVLLSTLIAFR